MRLWTDEEIALLKEHYPKKGRSAAAQLLGRSPGSVRQKASDLGLRQDRNSPFFKEWQAKAALSKVGKTKPAHSVIMKKRVAEGRIPACGPKSPAQRASISARAKKWHATHPHPRGFLGETHSPEARKLFSRVSKTMWSDPHHKINSTDYRQMISDRMHKMQHSGLLRNGYSRGQQGTYDINGKPMYFRSRWEANYALYLDFLVGQKLIREWGYEIDTFWFEEIRRGVRSYKPDFKVINSNGSIEYHEVKGWMDAKSKTKLARMAKYHPTVKIVLIDKEAYKSIAKWGRLIGEAVKVS